jgi:hypothetical protein
MQTNRIAIIETAIKMAGLFSTSLFIVLASSASGQYTALPPCLVSLIPRCVSACTILIESQSKCLQIIPEPCNGTSLGALITCVDDNCARPLSNTSLTLSPKALYSCQNSLIPRYGDRSIAMKVPSNGECVNSPYDFQSFVVSHGIDAHINTIAAQCRVELYQESNCSGQRTALDSSTIQHEGCTFKGGRSARLDCGDHFDPKGTGTSDSYTAFTDEANLSTAAYQSLSELCGNGSHNATVPSASARANSTLPATGTVSLPIVPHTPTASPTPALPGLGSTEKQYRRCTAALVAVLFVAVML